MASKQKHEILGGVKVSSGQLSKWGSSGGRPRKWKNEAERKRFAREQKKLAEQGKKLNPYRSFEGEKVLKERYGLCSNCGLKDNQYSFRGWEHYAWTANSDKWVCWKCYTNSMEKREEWVIEKRAGTNTERSQRSRAKQELKKLSSDAPEWENCCSFYEYNNQTKQYLTCDKPLFDKKKQLCRSHNKQVWKKFNQFLKPKSVSSTAAWLMSWDQSGDWKYFWNLGEEAEKS